MSAHKHRWQRLSDVALFCECGETKEVGAPVFPVHLCAPICTFPHWPAWLNPYVPYAPWQPTITWGDVTTGTTAPFDSTGITVWNT